VSTNAALSIPARHSLSLPDKSLWIMTLVLVVLAFFLIYPVLLLLVQSFNVAAEFFGVPKWGLDNWRNGFQERGLLVALANTVMVWAFSIAISLPIAIAIAWTLARTRIPFSRGLEFMFWVAFMLPSVSITIAWIALLDPYLGLLNSILGAVPFIGKMQFNIYSVAGIVWVHVVTSGIPVMVILLTPAFRNMDSVLEEASRVSGGSTFATMLRVTLPLMMPPIALVFALKLLRVFQTFDIELLLGTPINFFVYSTYIYNVLQNTPPNYGQATVLASVTLALIALIIPIQRWLLQRKSYSTITSKFKPGLISLGRWQPVALILVVLIVAVLTIVPFVALLVSSFMNRAGFFRLGFTVNHWQTVVSDPLFLRALSTTVVLATTSAIISPVLFSLLAYIIVRTKWRGRKILDSMIWISGAIPGMLSGLGLLIIFLGTPGLNVLYGTIWALIIVVILQGHTTGTNISKAAIIQVGNDMEEVARVSGATWLRAYFTIWLPLLMPTMALLAMSHFVAAAGTTSTIILLASRETTTLSLLALEYGAESVGNREAATVISLIIIGMTCVMAIFIRAFGLRQSVRHS
jgi:iron(III) transport system permease protein